MGKETLVKVVIRSIPIYAMSILWFPKCFYVKLCSLVAQFWWTNLGKDRGVHMIKWERLMESKQNGKGFCDLSSMDLAFLAKQA